MFDTKTLDKEAEQVRSTWSRYRGGRGTCVGVTGQTCVGVSGQRSCPRRRDQLRSLGLRARLTCPIPPIVPSKRGQTYH